MNSKIKSRGPEVDTELCVRQVGSKFDLVLIATARAREIMRKHREDNGEGCSNAVVSSLLEVQRGFIGREYLRKVRS